MGRIKKEWEEYRENGKIKERIIRIKREWEE